MASMKDANFGLRTALITITNQTVSRTLLVNTIVAYLVLFCSVFSLVFNYYQLLHLFSRSKAPLWESVIFFSLGSCRSGTLYRDFITIV